MTRGEGLLAAILANPAADLPRLVYADHLEENGEPERAEFIRLQIRRSELVAHLTSAGMRDVRFDPSEREHHLLTADVPHPNGGLRSQWEAWLGLNRVLAPTGYEWFHRGFVAEVRCTLANWIGGECGRCGGYGHHHRNDSLSVERVGRVQPWLICVACKGDKRTPGVGSSIVRSHPLERVVVTDREPWCGSWVVEGWLSAGTVPDSARIPLDVFMLLDGTRGLATVKATVTNLSDALIAYARGTKPAA